MWKQNADAHGGKNKCDTCGTAVVKPEKHTAGKTPPSNEGPVDHIDRRSEGGAGTPDNGRLLCRDCNRDREKLGKYVFETCDGFRFEIDSLHVP